MKKQYALFFIALAAACIISCKPSAPSCVITVMDKTGTQCIAGASVRLFATVISPNGPVTADLKADGVTDSNGKIKFTFKNPCIMDIRATVNNCTGTYCNGTGIAKFEDGTTGHKTVYINN